MNQVNMQKFKAYQGQDFEFIKSLTCEPQAFGFHLNCKCHKIDFHNNEMVASACSQEGITQIETDYKI